MERCVVEMNSHLVKNNYGSFVLTTNGILIPKIKLNGGNVLLLDVKTKNPIKMFINIFRIKNILIKNKIDLVDVVSRAPAWSVYFACKSLGIPLVTTVHGNYSVGRYSFFKRKYNSSMFLGDAVICVSNFIKNSALEKYNIFKKKYYESKVFVVPRGCDTEQFNRESVSNNRIINIVDTLNIPNDKQILLLPGRFADWKGQLYFLDVLKKIENKNYICCMVGSTKNKKYVNKVFERVRKYKIDLFVRIVDSVRDMPALYNVADVVVSSSIRGEAFGMVTLEAQSMNKIVVATKHGGTMETIDDGKTGFLVNPKNIEEFAKIIDNILVMPKEEKEKIGENARRSVINNFSIQKMCENTMNVYKKFL
ncbi:MAG: glycosyltransferase family 4 protein [Rickettsiales bacterium]|nr:glycosyltransferase family 4 protein [Rickettsiales bacterium]